MPTLVEQVETEISDSATNTKRVSPGKIQPVAVEVSCEEDAVVFVLWDSRAHWVLASTLDKTRTEKQQ